MAGTHKSTGGRAPGPVESAGPPTSPAVALAPAGGPAASPPDGRYVAEPVAAELDKAARPVGRCTLSVIVPVHNGGEGFRKCLESLAQLRPSPLEVIVVADGDTDGSGDLAGKMGFRVLATDRQSGPAKARNLGARHARGDILFFVDADVTVTPDAGGQVAGAFEADDKLTALFGSYDDDPVAKNFLSQYKNLFHHYVHQTGREEASTFWAACGAIRREAFGRLGGFDEGFGRPCIEDIELGYRIRSAGGRIRLRKNLQVKHLKVWGAASLLKSDFCDRALPWARLILRDRRFINDLNLKTSSRLSVLLAYGLVFSLPVAFWRPGALAAAAALALTLFIINLPVYRFFRRKRGAWFAARAIPWHWFYYLYGGAALAISLAGHGLGRRKLARRTGTRGEPCQDRRDMEQV